MIYSRRFVQHMLDRCQSAFTDDRRNALLARLNRQEIDAEWELITLYRLKEVGQVHYERPIGRVTPDISLSFGAGNTLICDVTTVSDDDYKGRSLIANFDAEARRRIRQFGLSPDKFSFQIEYSGIGPERNMQMKIDLPSNKLADAFPNSFYDFLTQVRVDQTQNRQAWIRERETRYSMTYHPRSSYQGQSWSPFAGKLHSKRNNPITNALENKRKSLRSLPKEFPRGIILCDGGCDSISIPYYDPTSRTYPVDELIWDLLRKSRSVAFVVLQYTPVGSFRPENKLSLKLFVNENADVPLTTEMIDALCIVPTGMPRMMFAPYQARSLARSGALGPKKAWYTSMELHMSATGEQRIMLSARLLRDFLAGKIDETEFKRRAIGKWQSYFEGKLIAESYIEKGTQFDDDDHLVFRMEEDPAASKFR